MVAMKTLRALLIVCLTFLDSPAPTFAQSNVFGVGQTSCREIRSFLDSERGSDAILAWSAGFLTGLNFANEIHTKRYRDISGLPRSYILSQVQDFCAANPSKPAFEAIGRLYSRLPVVD